jgi:hypothetical protein
MNKVVFEPPVGPLTAEQITLLDATLAVRVDLSSREMGVHKLVWQEALSICTTFFEN